MNISYQEKKEILKEVDSIKFADVVCECKNIAEERKAQFLQKEDFEELKSVSNVSEFIDRFYKIYQSNSFVFSAEVANAYDDLLDDSYHYKWNVPITDIVKRIEDINSVGVIYIPPNAGVLNSIPTVQANIGDYFREELISIVANSGRFQSDDPDFLQKLKEGFNFNHGFENYLERREYYKKNKLLDKKKRQSASDEELNELFDVVETFWESDQTEVDGKATKKVIRNIAKGRVENEYLKMLFEVTLFAPGYNDIEKYTNFYPLLQFLLHDKKGKGGIYNLYTKDEFEEKGLTYTGVGIYYDGDYKKYQRESVERILGL